MYYLASSYQIRAKKMPKICLIVFSGIVAQRKRVRLMLIHARALVKKEVRDSIAPHFRGLYCYAHCEDEEAIS